MRFRYDSNTGAYGGCNSNCTLAGFCGDGNQDSNEACDEGTANNTGNYGGCNDDCTLASYCGDGMQDSNEDCDEGTANNTGDYNGCNSDCTLADFCGDGSVQDGEGCDNNGMYPFTSSLECDANEACVFCHETTCQLTGGHSDCTYIRPGFEKFEFMGCPPGQRCDLYSGTCTDGEKEG